MDKTDNFIDTYTGMRVSIPIPELEQIKIEDIAHSLSMQCRYTGHTEVHYSVGEHSVRAARITPLTHKLSVLLHDGSEYIMTDVSRPMKVFLPDYRALEDVIQKKIYEAFGINGYDKEIIKWADNVMLATECRDLMPRRNGWFLTEEPLSGKIVPWSARKAEHEFLILFRRLTNEQK